MKNMFRFVLIMMAFSVIAPSVNAGQLEELRLFDKFEQFKPVKLFDKLPVKYVGTFQWENSHQLQKVEFNFESQRVDKGNFLLIGEGVYVTIEGRTTIVIKSVVNPNTHEVEIWEALPDTENFVTNGSHVGNISSDLKNIEATWTSKHTGNKGVLKLRRKEE